MPYLDRDDAQIYFRDDGAGEATLVLLHDYFGTGASWDAQRSELSRYFRVITPDLRGHGRSVMEPGRLTVSAIGDDVVAIMHEVGAPSVHLVGASLGAVVALHLARTEPELIASLVVASVPYLRDPAARDYARLYIDSVFPRLEHSLERRHGAGRPRYAREVLLTNFEQDLEEYPADHLAATEQCEHVNQPTLLVAGDRDPAFPPRRAVELAERVPNSTLALLPATGHLVHRDMPSLFTHLVYDHIARVTANV